MNLLELKIIAAIIIFIIAIIAGWIPFHKKFLSSRIMEFPAGESFACGIFLGAGLIHMLSDAAHSFKQLGYHYPYAFVIAGLSFLLMLWLEHLGRELQEHKYQKNTLLVIIGTCMLSIHSFLAGAALGLSLSVSIFVMILIAILAHKWAAGFALAVQINKSALKIKTGLTAYFIFALMTPLGIIFGGLVTGPLSKYHLIEPIFTSLAAGTFLYLGTLHGLKRAVMIERCCNLKGFTYVIAGFILMALIALWT